jgi:hypothetical protein
MINSVEILRAICFKDETKDIKSSFTFTEKEIDFMIQFKMIYEIGESQLKLFLDKLENEGDELDEYSIQYYVDQLQNGPLNVLLQPLLAVDPPRKYFRKKPDSMGQIGNSERTDNNVSVMAGLDLPLAFPVDAFNKSPKFVQDISKKAIQNVEDMFRTSLRSSTVIDNTLPLVDKKPQDRYGKEPKGDLVKEAHGNYLVKDVYYFENMKPIRQKIFDKVEQDLGAEDYRIYKFEKEYNPFDSEKNDAKTDKEIFEVEVSEVLYDFENNEFMTYNGNVGEVVKNKTVKNDMFGNEYDSDQKRARLYKIPNIEEDREFLLNSNIGDDNPGMLSEKED